MQDLPHPFIVDKFTMWIFFPTKFKNCQLSYSGLVDIASKNCVILVTWVKPVLFIAHDIKTYISTYLA